MGQQTDDNNKRICPRQPTELMDDKQLLLIDDCFISDCSNRQSNSNTVTTKELNISLTIEQNNIEIIRRKKAAKLHKLIIQLVILFIIFVFIFCAKFWIDSRKVRLTIAEEDDDDQSVYGIFGLDQLGEQINNGVFTDFEHSPCYRKSSKNVQLKTYPRKWEAIDYNEGLLPDNWDWRNARDRNYCGVDRTQAGCGSCWTFGTLSALADRFSIAQNNRAAEVMLSPQTVMECVTTARGYPGSEGCDGGNAADVYAYAESDGIPHESNNIYRASSFNSTCHPVKGRRFRVANYGPIAGRRQMKMEIFTSGPIACSVKVTPVFRAFNGTGIIADQTTETTDHVVEIVGWGIDAESRIEYWIGRNSWGQYWGDNGWFRIVTSAYLDGSYTLKIEDDCFWADPIV